MYHPANSVLCCNFDFSIIIPYVKTSLLRLLAFKTYIENSEIFYMLKGFIEIKTRLNSFYFFAKSYGFYFLLRTKVKCARHPH